MTTGCCTSDVTTGAFAVIEAGSRAMYAYSGRVRRPISDIYSVVGRVSPMSGILVKLKPACGAAWAFAMDGIVDGRTPCAPISRISQLFALFAFLTSMNDRCQGNVTTGLRLRGCTVFRSFGLVLAILTIQGLRWFSQVRLPGSRVLSAFLRRTRAPMLFFPLSHGARVPGGRELFAGF